MGGGEEKGVDGGVASPARREAAGGRCPGRCRGSHGGAGQRCLAARRAVAWRRESPIGEGVDGESQEPGGSSVVSGGNFFTERGMGVIWNSLIWCRPQEITEVISCRTHEITEIAWN
jgi:hypothetical protein